MYRHFRSKGTNSFLFLCFSSRTFMPATSICYLDECIHRSDAPFGNAVITEFEAWGHPLRVGQVSAHLQVV